MLKKLEEALKDKDVSVRIAAVQALADMKVPQAIPALEATLQHDDVPEQAFAAAKALFALKDPAGTKALLEVYQKMDTSSSLLKKESRSFFQKCRSIHSAAMFVVSEGIGYVPVPGVGEGFSAMTDLIGDPDLSARSNVVLLLAKNKGPQAQDILKSGLNDDDWSVRAATAQMIAHMAQVDLRESLVPLFEDKRIR